MSAFSIGSRERNYITNRSCPVHAENLNPNVSVMEPANQGAYSCRAWRRCSNLCLQVIQSLLYSAVGAPFST
jgi:hypothetical protein